MNTLVYIFSLVFAGLLTVAAANALFALAGQFRAQARLLDACSEETLSRVIRRTESK